MISFFLKIRQKRLSQNRVTGYLIYALEEIFLGVFRILKKIRDVIQSYADRILRYMNPEFVKVNITDNGFKAYPEYVLI